MIRQMGEGNSVLLKDAFFARKFGASCQQSMQGMLVRLSQDARSRGLDSIEKRALFVLPPAWQKSLALYLG